MIGAITNIISGLLRQLLTRALYISTGKKMERADAAEKDVQRANEIDDAAADARRRGVHDGDNRGYRD